VDLKLIQKMKLKTSVLWTLAFGICLFSELAAAQQKESRNSPKVILITLDGFRWQELFSGADVQLIENKEVVGNTKELKETFWKETPEERRQTLLPFLWNTASKIGQLHGNRALNSNVNVTNGMWFSYPGYNEILTGHADDTAIHSNDKIYNPNKTILEIVNQTKPFEGKVAAFGSWDVFPYIVNDQRSGIPVNAGYAPAAQKPLSDRETFLNALQMQTPKLWDSVRFDAFTQNFALEYMKKSHPNLVYISYGETDDFAHEGKYDAYLKSAHASDAFIKELWDFVQTDDFYKDQTTIIISTDHGRGSASSGEWKSHGSKINGADQVWLVSFGAGVSALGEVKNSEQLHSNQIAATIAKILKVPFNEVNAGKPVETIKL
jgi:hypothetical protein